MTGTFDNVAQLLMREHASGTRYHRLSPETGVTNLEAAYAVQRRYVHLMIPAAGAPAGYKIGLTSARMQKMCNIDSPLAGVVLASRVLQSGVALQIGRYGRLGLEFEVGVRLGAGPAAATDALYDGRNRQGRRWDLRGRRNSGRP
jgi:2-keto-4-pentenoate hydratase